MNRSKLSCCCKDQPKLVKFDEATGDVIWRKGYQTKYTTGTPADYLEGGERCYTSLNYLYYDPVYNQIWATAYESPSINVKVLAIDPSGLVNFYLTDQAASYAHSPVSHTIDEGFGGSGSVAIVSGDLNPPQGNVKVRTYDNTGSLLSTTSTVWSGVFMGSLPNVFTHFDTTSFTIGVSGNSRTFDSSGTLIATNAGATSPDQPVQKGRSNASLTDGTHTGLHDVIVTGYGTMKSGYYSTKLGTIDWYLAGMPGSGQFSSIHNCAEAGSGYVAMVKVSSPTYTDFYEIATNATVRINTAYPVSQSLYYFDGTYYYIVNWDSSTTVATLYKYDASSTLAWSVALPTELQSAFSPKFNAICVDNDSNIYVS